LIYYDAFSTPSPRFLTYIVKKNIKLVNWSKLDLDVHQIWYSYDPQNQRTDGMIVTTADIAGIERKKTKDRYIGDLYIRARTQLGLWEATMTKVHIKELGRQCYWFRYDNAISHKILEKPQKQ